MNHAQKLSELRQLIALFLSIVWRPVTCDAGDTYWQSWRKYRMDAKTAWKIAKLAYPVKP